MEDLLNLMLVITAMNWGFVTLLLGGLLFLKFFPEKRKLIAGQPSKRAESASRIGKRIILGWMVFLLILMAIQVYGIVISGHEILSLGHQKTLEGIGIAAFTLFGIVIPGYVILHLIPRIFGRKD